MKKGIIMYSISAVLIAISIYFFAAGFMFLYLNDSNDKPHGEPAALVEVYEIGMELLSVEKRNEILTNLDIDVDKYIELNMSDYCVAFFRKGEPQNIIMIELVFDQITKLTIHLNDKQANHAFSAKSIPYSRKEFGEFVLGVYENDYDYSTTIRYNDQISEHVFYINCLFQFESELTQDFLTKFFNVDSLSSDGV